MSGYRPWRSCENHWKSVDRDTYRIKLRVGGTMSRRDFAPGSPRSLRPIGSRVPPARGLDRAPIPPVAVTAMNTKEIVLGLGPQNSLWSVVHLAEEQLRAAHGAPRMVVARAPAVEIEATRPQFDGEFQGFTVRLRGVGGPVREA